MDFIVTKSLESQNFNLIRFCFVQLKKISIHSSKKGFSKTPPALLEILIKLHTFLKLFWSSRNPTPGNSNPFSGISMDNFWNCTYEDFLLLKQISIQLLLSAFSKKVGCIDAHMVKNLDDFFWLAFRIILWSISFYIVSVFEKHCFRL